MNRSQRFIFCVPVLLVLAALALVRTSYAGDEWQPILPADLALKDNPASPGANAMILYRENDVNEKFVRTDGSAIYEYVRIKIFTKEGVKSADVEIPFIKDVSDIKDVRGRTIHPDGTIINFEGKPFEKTIVKHSGERFLAKTFTLPDAQPGSVIEYRYRLQYRPHLLVGEEWVLSSELYTREGHFSLTPFESSYSNFPLYFRLYGIPANAPPQRGIDGVYKMAVHDIPGIDDEAYMPPLRTLQSRVVFYHTDNGSVENDPPDHFWKSTEKSWNDEVEHFVGKKNSLSAEVSKTVSSGDSAEVKLRKLYERAQQIRNLADEEEKTQDEQKSEDIKKNANVEDVLQHGYGNSYQINLLYVALVRAAGYEANSVRVVPRNVNNDFHPALEDRYELAADIVWARADGKEFYVDPGAPNYPFNLLPWFETDTPGLRISGKTDDKIMVPKPASSDATIVRHADLAIAEDGSATGTIAIDFTGQEGALVRRRNHKDDDTGRRKAMEEQLKGWLPHDAEVEITKLDNWDKDGLPVHVEAKVKLPELASVAGHRLLVPASLFVAAEVAAFQPAVRHNDISFRYPWEKIDDLKYSAPAGYKIETVPGKVATNPTSIVVYQISTTQQGSTAEVQRHLTVNTIKVERQYYGALRNFFNGMKTSDDNQIVLQNAESAQK